MILVLKSLESIITCELHAWGEVIIIIIYILIFGNKLHFHINLVLSLSFLLIENEMRKIRINNKNFII